MYKRKFKSYRYAKEKIFIFMILLSKFSPLRTGVKRGFAELFILCVNSALCGEYLWVHSFKVFRYCCVICICPVGARSKS